MRVQLAGHTLGHHHGFLEKVVLRLDVDREAAGKLEDLPQNIAKRHLAERLSHHRFGHGADRLRERRQRHIIAKHAGIRMKPRHEIVIAIKHRRQKAGQKQPVGEVEMPHDAEIDRHQRAVGRDEDIAGMHVGMEKAVPEHLVEETARRRFGDFLYVMSRRLEPGNVVDPDTFDPFDDKHRRGGVFEIDPGNMDAAVLGHVVGKLAGGGRLQSQIELDV